ncbi:C-type lectin domain family 9 member A-like isoform X2 [Colius striatus]|uniref:C-type lectin domain family 9 member A-like isoform X2 n=1 Tax=Colius striatus TaxID=57412 RepID=UPI002B1E3E8C|nr:C-type lectin domain family 9 member A-like isoform X2 [Colius striatus]
MASVSLGHRCFGFLSCPLLPPLPFHTMEDEAGYIILEPRGKQALPLSAGCSRRDPQGAFAPRQPSVPAGISPRCCRLLGALTAALALGLVLCLSRLLTPRGQAEGTAGSGNASLPGACGGVSCGCPELRRSLCPLQEGGRCSLCPAGWTQRRSKCYRVSEGLSPWSGSRQDCVARGAELLMLEDQDELDFVNEMLQNPSRAFWLGLLLPSAGQGWTWLNGSRLEQSRFRPSPGAEGSACGVLSWDRIGSAGCGSRYQWICQRGAIEL